MSDVEAMAALRGQWPFAGGWAAGQPTEAHHGAGAAAAGAGAPEVESSGVRTSGILTRLQALRETALLDSPADEAFDRLARLAARVLQAPTALVTLVDEDRQFFKSCIGLPEPWASRRQTPLSHSFCQHAVTRGAPLVIGDAREHPLVCANPAIEELGVVAYLGMPLVTSDGVALGSFCVIDSVPRRWSAEDLMTLGDLAAAVMTEIELRATLRRTETARAEAAAAARAKDDCLAFIGHELRTPLNAIAGNLQLLAAGHCGPLSERQDRAVQRLARSQGELVALSDRLLEFRTLAAGQADVFLGRVPIHDALEQAVHAAREELSRAGVWVNRTPLASGDPTAAVHADAAKLHQILVTLLETASRYSRSGDAVAVEADASGRRFHLRIWPTALDLPADRAEGLFEPFGPGSGQYAAPSLGTGLGLAIARALARAMDGDLVVENAPSGAAAFVLRLSRL